MTAWPLKVPVPWTVQLLSVPETAQVVDSTVPKRRRPVAATRWLHRPEVSAAVPLNWSPFERMPPPLTLHSLGAAAAKPLKPSVSATQVIRPARHASRPP
jgi:hypothetical protein